MAWIRSGAMTALGSAPISSGSQTVKTAPPPSSDSTVTAPPWASVSWRAIVSPNPASPFPRSTLALVVALPSPLEDTGMEMGGQAGPLVDHRDPGPVVELTPVDADRRPLRRHPHRVAEKVPDGDTHRGRVDRRHGRMRCPDELHIDPTGTGGADVLGHRRLGEVGQVDRAVSLLDRQPAVAGEIVNGSRHPAHRPAGGVDVPRCPGLVPGLDCRELEIRAHHR